jgi:hypothetical protein
MLSFEDPIWPVAPPALRKSLEEETLDLEERVRLCESDARQFLSVRPALAWSRARQAVALLGEQGGKFSVTDPAARRSAHMTLCEIEFTLAARRVSLPKELGHIDLYGEAAKSAFDAKESLLGIVITDVKWHERAHDSEKLAGLWRLAESLAKNAAKAEPWLVVELQPRAEGWLQTLEDQLQHAPLPVFQLLPSLYGLFAPADAESRTRRARELAIRAAMRLKSYDQALELLRGLPMPDARLVAECREGLGDFEAAAAEFVNAGRPEDALRCFRSIPDFDRSLELLNGMPDHPARASLQWLQQMRDLAARRPGEFSKMVLPSEKKLLEGVLEASLGVTRKKAAAKKTAGPKRPVGRPRKKTT